MSNTSTDATTLDAFNSAPHIWIECWDEEVEALRAAALAAGWTWHRVDTSEDLPVLLRAVELANSRHQDLMPAERRRYLAAVGHIVIAVGPGYEDSYRYLRWIARSGGHTGIHLAIAASHRRNPLAPQDLKDSITAPPNAYAGPVSDSAPAARSSEHPWMPTSPDEHGPDDDSAPAGLLESFRRRLRRRRKTDRRVHPAQQVRPESDPAWLDDDPRVQAIVTTATRDGWRHEPDDAQTAVWRFVHDIGTTLTVHWGTPEMPLLHASATATATVRWGATTWPVLAAASDAASSSADSIVLASDADAQWIESQIDRVQGFLRSHPAEYRVMSQISADPRARSVIGAAEQHGWAVQPHNVDRCIFARGGTEIWLRWGIVDCPWLFLYAHTAAHGDGPSLYLYHGDQPPEEQLAAMLRFLATPDTGPTNASSTAIQPNDSDSGSETNSFNTPT